MEQNKKIRVLITTKDETFDRLKGFVPIAQKLDWNICYDLFHREIEKDESFNNYLKGITLETEDGIKYSLWDNEDNSFDFSDPSFLRQIIHGKESDTFFDKLKEVGIINERLLQNGDGSVWVVPTLCSEYDPSNVEYVEKLIEWAQQGCDELYLLLHDKDIYNTGDSIMSHRVQLQEEERLSSLLKNEDAHYPNLVRLINEGKVSVFIHNSDEDSYCKEIVWNDNLSNMKVEDIINTLYIIPRNIEISHKIGEGMTKREIIEKLENLDITGCDFSLKFLG